MHVGKIDLQIQIAAPQSNRSVHNLLQILFRTVQHQNRNDIDYSRNQNSYNTAAAQNQVARKQQQKRKQTSDQNVPVVIKPQHAVSNPTENQPQHGIAPQCMRPRPSDKTQIEKQKHIVQ